MAFDQVTAQIAIAFASQATPGTIDPTLDALVSPIDLADGVVLGVADAGIIDSGIEFEEERILRENPDVAGSFTKNASVFLRSEPSSFSITFPLGGARNAASGPPVDVDFQQDPGIDAIFRCAGLIGAVWAGGVGYEYTPANILESSAVIWLSGRRYALKDVLCESLVFVFTPGDVTICTATFRAVVHAHTIVAFPTVSFGVQATISPPLIESVGNAWEDTRPFSDMTVTIDNALEDIPDSNVVGGTRSRQTSRDITVAATMSADATNVDFSREKLVATVAPTEDITFTVGTAATGTDAVNAFTMNLNNVETRSLGAATHGADHADVINSILTGLTSGSEMSLIMI